MCVFCAVSRLLALLHLRYGRLSSHLTLCAVYLYFYFYLLVTTFVLYFCPHFGVDRLHVLHPVNREAVLLVHTVFGDFGDFGVSFVSTVAGRLYFLCFLSFSSHTPLSFERESSETILLFSDSGGSEVG